MDSWEGALRPCGAGREPRAPRVWFWEACGLRRGGEMTQGPSEAEGRVGALLPCPLIGVASSGVESGQANVYQHIMSRGTFSPGFLLSFTEQFS